MIACNSILMDFLKPATSCLANNNYYDFFGQQRAEYNERQNRYSCLQMSSLPLPIRFQLRTLSPVVHEQVKISETGNPTLFSRGGGGVLL